MTAIRPFLLTPRRSAARWPLAAAAALAAGAHVPVIGEHLQEAPYMGVLFLVLTAACSLLAVAALVRDSAAVYVASAATCALAVAGYVATRVVAFPMLADDVGNWLEPLGVVSIAAETVVVACGLLALRRRAVARGRHYAMAPDARSAVSAASS